MSDSPYPKTATDPLGIHGQDAGLLNTGALTSADPWAMVHTSYVTTGAGGFSGSITGSLPPPKIVAPPGWKVVVSAGGFLEMVPDEPPPAAPVAAVGPRKPPPALPVEVHNTQEFDAERAQAHS